MHWTKKSIVNINLSVQNPLGLGWSWNKWDQIMHLVN